MIPSRELLAIALLFPSLGAAALLATGGCIVAPEACARRGKDASKGEVAGWVCFTVVHATAAVYLWYALAFVARPFG